MSGFQFQDLGTGRQYVNTQNNMNRSRMDIAPLQGGQSLRGTDSQYTANNVDAVSYLLGSAAQGVQNFMAAKNTMQQAFESQAQKEIDVINNEHAKRLEGGMAPEEATELYLNDTRELYKSGKINKNLKAAQTLNSQLLKAQGANNQDIATRVLEKLALDRAKVASNPELRRDLLDSPEISIYEGTQVGSLIKSKLAEYRTADEQAISVRNYGEDLAHMQSAFKNSLAKDFPTTESMMDFMNQAGIDWDSPEAASEMGLHLLATHWDPVIEGARPEAQEGLRRMAATYVAPEVTKRLEMVRQKVRENEQTANKARGVATFEAVFKDGTLTSASAYSQAREAFGPDSAESMVALGVRTEAARGLNTIWDGSNQTGNKADFFFKTIQKEGTEMAADSADPIGAFRRQRMMIPGSIAEAESLGWLSPDEADNTTEEAWQARVTQWTSDLREAQLTASIKPFKAAIDQAAGDPVRLSQAMDDLFEIAGPDFLGDEMYEGLNLTSDDSDNFIRPLVYSGEGTVFQNIYNDIATATNKAVANLAYDFPKGVQFLHLRQMGSSPQEAMQLAGLSSIPDRSTLESHIGGAVAEMANGNASFDQLVDYFTQRSGQLPAHEQQIADMLMDMSVAGRDITNDPAAQATIHGMLVRGWADGPGLQTSATMPYLIADETKNFVVGMFGPQSQHDGLPLEGENALKAATLWQSLSHPDPKRARAMRKEVFGKHYDAAALTNAIVEDTGGIWNSEQLQYTKKDGTPFDGLEFTQDVDIRGMRDAAESLTYTLDNAGAGTLDDFIGDIVPGLLNPLSINLEATSEYSMAKIRGLMESSVKDWEEEVRDMVGAQSDDDRPGLLLSPRQRAAIEEDVKVGLLKSLSRDPELVGDPKALGEKVAALTKTALSGQFNNAAYIGGRLVDDPEGQLKDVMDEIGSNKPSEVWGRIGDTEMQGIMEARGRSNVDGADLDRVMGEDFYAIIDMPGDDDQDPVLLTQTARKLAKGQEPTLNDFMTAHLVIKRGEPTSGPTFNSDRFQNPRVESVNGRLEFIFPQLDRTGATALTGVALNYPSSVLAGQTFKWPVKAYRGEGGVEEINSTAPSFKPGASNAVARYKSKRNR